MPAMFGIEEEFVLLDQATLTPVDAGALAVTDLRGDFAGLVEREFFPSQIEHASPVFATADEALDALTAFRRALGAWAEDAGVVVASAGTPFRTQGDVAITPGERYGRISRDIAALTADHQINGLHVHVGIPDRDAGVRASNALRAWLPLLLALSADSPFWSGEDTGFDSWRTIHGRRWTTFGVPPWFRDAAEYDEAVEAITGLGATSDAGTINWNVRLSSGHPTVEVRVCDAQLDPVASVALATVIRALATAGMARDTAPPRPFGSDLANAGLWHAARYGMGNGVVHPLTGRLAPAESAVHALAAEVAPHLRDDEGAIVAALLEQVLRSGNGVTAQRLALRAGGVPALADLYRRRLVRDLAAAPGIVG
jgi:glutamate---cysteine ligase / carboxylate-amine ligase